METKLIISFAVEEDGAETLRATSTHDVYDTDDYWDVAIGDAIRTVLSAIKGFNPDADTFNAVLHCAFLMDDEWTPLRRLYYARSKWSAQHSFSECYSLTFDIEKLMDGESEKDRDVARNWLEAK